MKGWSKITLETLNNGEGIRLVNDLIPVVAADFAAPGKDKSKARKIVLTMEFRPEKTDSDVIVPNIYAQAKLAPQLGECDVTLSVGADENGEVSLLAPEGVQGTLIDGSGRVVEIGDRERS